VSYFIYRYDAQSAVHSYKSFVHEVTVGTVHSAQSAVVLHRGKKENKRKREKQVYTTRKMNCAWESITEKDSDNVSTAVKHAKRPPSNTF
jgi:hypothetical protein